LKVLSSQQEGRKASEEQSADAPWFCSDISLEGNEQHTRNELADVMGL
jgi:hypothetical protein